MTSNPPKDSIPRPLATIQMNASEFKHFVTNVTSARLRQKLMPVARVCEGESTHHTEITKETLSQFVQRSNARTARSYFSGPRKKATSDSRVSSTHHSTEGSQEYILAQELELAKASGIDSTFVENIQAVKTFVTTPTNSSIQEVLDDCIKEIDDLLILASSPHLALQSPQDPPADKVPESENREEQQVCSENDAGDLICAVPQELVQNNEMLTESQESTVVNSNEGSQLGVSSVPGDQNDNVQALLPAPLSVQDYDGNLFTSQTSQIFFSAMSAVFDSSQKSPTSASQATLGSIEAHVGSSGDSNGSEADYMPPWEVADGQTSSNTHITASEEMALVTEDFTEAEHNVPMDGVEVSLPATEPTSTEPTAIDPARSSEDIASIGEQRDELMEAVDDLEQRLDEVAVSNDDTECEEDLESGSDSDRISFADASLVLMQRNKNSTFEEGSTDCELSSDGF